MVGHGSPRTSRRRHLPATRNVAAAPLLCCALLMVLAVGRPTLVLADELGVRIAWGGGDDRLWRGSIAVSDGSLSEPKLLGIEADEPGSMWIDSSGRLIVRQRNPRNYDGVDLLVSAPPTAKLLVQLSADDDAGAAQTLEIPLADLSGEYVNKELDKRGNRLLAMRAPGDMLRVRLARDNVVFSPGETLRFDLEAHGLPLPKDGAARLKIQLLGPGGKEWWTKQYDWAADRIQSLPIEIPLPEEEGVYDLLVTAANSPRWSEAVRKPLGWKRTIGERRVQLLVLGARRTAAASRGGREFAQLLEIDPANPRWFEKLGHLPQWSKARLPRTWKGPLGNGCSQSRRHALGELAQLKPNAESPDVSWEAYWLPISQPGRPHILEIDYPSDVPQTLGLSILEPNAAGGIAPVGIDSGVDNTGDAAGSSSPPQWLRHRIVFWPHTTTPLLLVTNGRTRAPAVYGKIRVLAGGEALPAALPDHAGANRRLLAAFLDRPLLPETFAANESLDPWSGRSLDDWNTFYESGSRLIEYLHYAGYNGLMLGVLADGSAIYPSDRLQSTPRYDTGVFFASGQDPVRKDVLEMLLRLFDRENLQLIPSVEFAAPLPELEAIRRAGGAEAEGIAWIGPDGADWCATWPPRRGLAPYYNLLHPRVQQAMLGVLREVATRCAQHPSFSGLAVRLSADGYAQLPGPRWGMDDTTIGQFERDTRVRVPGKGPRRFAQRAAFLEQEPQRSVWLDWRAAQLAKFYRRAGEELAAIRPGSRLYLAGAGMIAGPELDVQLRPSLPRSATAAAALLQVGIDPKHFRDGARNIVLLRPGAIASEGNLGSRAADLEIEQMTDIDQFFQQVAASGSLFFHPPRDVHIGSFDQKSPFKPTYTWLVSQPTPSGQQNRRRWIHGLATLDSQLIVDGGWTLPMGQESAMRHIVAAYRALPAVRFQAVAAETPDAAQPVTFRSGTFGGRTYLYAVNDAPFAVTARIHIEASPNCRIEELTGLRRIAPLQPESGSGMYWEVALAPYDLAAVRLSEPSVALSAPHATWSEEAEAAMSLQIRRLGSRTAALGNPRPWDAVANPSFERSAGAGGQIPDWSVSQDPAISIALDKTQPINGAQSVKISSKGPVACLVSRPMAAPTTGRLAVSVWLRVDNETRQPPLCVAVEGKVHGRDYYRFAPFGQAPGPGQPANPIASEWRRYVVNVDDLPMEGLSSLRVRFDLMGAGEVWVDNVQVFNLLFSPPEMQELGKLVTDAAVKLKNGQVGDCVHLLEGYWPRFLEENVALPAGAGETASSQSAAPPPDEKPPERTGLLNRVKDILPDSLRF